MLLTIFNKIPDTRRTHGRMYDLPHVLLFSTFAIMSGADSYRKISDYIEANFNQLKNNFEIKWKKAPSYTGIRKIIQGVDKNNLEKAFREYAKEITKLEKTKKHLFIGLDGKVLKGSFDNFNDKKAVQIFSAFLTGEDIILAHEEIGSNKKNEIEVAKKMMKVLNNLDIEKCIVTLDALHCQKKHWRI